MTDARDRTPATRRTARALPTQRADSIQAETVNWLWEGWLPRGKVVTLEGNPGLGKSTLTIALTASLTTARQLPDGTMPTKRERVLLVSSEDGAADTIRPRLDAAKADLARVQLITEVPDRSGIPRLMELPQDLESLESTIVKKHAGLVIIDPLSAHLGERLDPNSDKDVRRMLGPFALLAQRTGACMLLVRHLNKSGSDQIVQRSSGSVAWLAAARASLLVAEMPSDPKKGVFAVAKSNLAEVPPPLAFKLVSEGTVAKVRWLGPTNVRVSELLSSQPVAVRDQATLFLTDRLSGGPVRQKTLQAEGEERNLSLRSLERAKTDLGVTSYSKPPAPGKRGRGVSMWKLPE